MKAPLWTGLAHKNLFIIDMTFQPIIFFYPN
jgi:hypothetical protein